MNGDVAVFIILAAPKKIKDFSQNESEVIRQQ